jgi:hypothetical protein
VKREGTLRLRSAASQNQSKSKPTFVGKQAGMAGKSESEKEHADFVGR